MMISHLPVAPPQPVFAVLRSPVGHEGQFVVQRFVSVPDPEPFVIADSLDAAREALIAALPGVVWYARDVFDAPEIVEIWI